MKTSLVRSPKNLLTTAILILAAAGQSAQAATATWVGDTSNLWNTSSNWSGGTPVNGDSLVFGAPGFSGVALSNDIPSLTVGGSGTDGITFGLSASSYTISRPGAQTLTLGSSAGGIGIKNTSLFLQTISSPLIYGSNQTIQVGATTGAPLSSLTLSGAQTGVGFRLTKTGTGLLTLSGANTFSGLTINGGTVNVATDGNLGTVPGGATAGSIVLNGGALRTNLNGGALTINANRGIALGDGTVGSGGTINTTVTNAAAANTATLTYNGIIANNGGTNSLTKTGNQILSLGGINTYTGATRINQGELLLNYAAVTAVADNIISSSSDLVMGGVPTALANGSTAGNPILLMQGNSTTARSQTFASTTINQGNSRIVARGDGAVDATLALGALTHTPGGTVGFSLLTNGTAGKGVITTTTGNTNGILGGWATTSGAAVSGTAPLTQTDWATNDGSGNIVAYTGYTIASTGVPLANNAADNVRINDTSTGNVSLTFASNVSDLNTIQTTGTVSRTVNTGSGNTLRLGSFGGVWTASTGALTIGGIGSAAGTLTAGGAASTPGEIVFNAGATITINSVIADNGVGNAVSVVKTGAGSLTLNSANTFTGGMFINQGTVSAGNGGAFGGAGRDVTIHPGGAVNLTGVGVTYANNFNLAGSGLTPGANTLSGTITLLGDTVIGNSGAVGANFTGQITGDYNLSLLGSQTLSSTANDFGGNLGINGITGASASGAVTVKLGNSEVISNGAGKGNVYIAGSATVGNFATLDLNGKNETINGLVSAGTLAQVRITNTDAATATLTLGDNDQTATYGGTILDGTGKVAITKIGAGTQTLSGANTYTGTTTVSAGTLLLSSSTVNSTISASVTIDVQTGAKLDVRGISTAGGFIVGSTQTLKGTGTVVGLTTISTGGNLSPGSSPGNLTFTNGLNLAGTYNWELGALSTSGPGTNFDVVTITAGNIDLTGGSINLTLGGFAPTNVAFWQADQTWFSIINNTGAGSLTGSFAAIDNTAWSSLGSFSTVNVGNDVNLVWTAVPEPSTCLLLAAGVAVMALRRRR